MDVSLLKPIYETKYLAVENAFRYRAILRYFFMQHERMRHYLFAEEIYTYLKSFDMFRSYTEEELQQDLEQLVKWKNLIARQEMGKVRTIEEFKKKKFRYQCSPYTVEIERMVMKLEQLGDSFGGSLEKTLFDRLHASLQKVKEVLGDSAEQAQDEIYRVWEDTFDYFKKIIQNSSDYIAYLQSENIEEKMMTEAFLAYKEQFTVYLRDFIVSLQQTSFKIETILTEISEEDMKQLAITLADYQLKVPRFEDIGLSREELELEYVEKWNSLKVWFVGTETSESELLSLQYKTNDMIRKITRVVQRLGERHQNFRSRKQDYLHLAKWFSSLENIEEAHKLSSVVFGCFHTRHFVADNDPTEDIYSDVWDEKPAQVITKPIVKYYREKTKPTAIIDNQEEKEEVMKQHLRERENEQAQIAQLIHNKRIKMSDLPVIEPFIRKTLLSWIGKSMAKEDKVVKTETGQRIQVNQLDDEAIIIEATDGKLSMPNFEIQFLD
ncbi:TIGR02677 family protein [Bacillus tianshenii]|nr:TIGR02677 family protein [Bacillus tianshenii]